MRVISVKPLREFWERHPDAESSLKAWFHEVKRADWATSAALKRAYPYASIINAERVVFNICGNKYRLIARMNYSGKTVFIRFVGTHAEYERIDPVAI
jgi:mRNA interferase HigB